MQKISRSITIDAPVEAVYKLVADFAGYPKFIPEVLSAKILKRSASSIDVSFVVDLMVKNEYTLRFELKEPDAITWNMIEGKNMKSNSGSWKFKAKGRSSTLVTYNVNVEFEWFVPGSIAGSLIEKNLPKMLECFKSRAELKKVAKKCPKKR